MTCRRRRRTTLALVVALGAFTAAPGGPAAARAGRARSRRSVRATLDRIAECESGGDPRAVSPGGRYRGKYQFSVATWQALGGRGDPAEAPERVQDRMAAKLLRLRGTSPWPNCA